MSQKAGAIQSSLGLDRPGHRPAATASIVRPGRPARPSRPSGNAAVIVIGMVLDRRSSDSLTRRSRASSSDPAPSGRPRCRRAAAMNSRNRGWARVGFDLNSGWNWTARNQGWSVSSTISTIVPSGLMPVGDEAVLLEVPPVGVVELVAVAVPLVDQVDAVGLAGHAVGGQGARPGAEPHRAAALADRLLVGHQADDGVLGRLCRTRCCWRPRARARPGELDDGALHPQADAEVRDAACPGVADRLDLALDPPHPEPAGHEDAVDPAQDRLGAPAARPPRPRPARPAPGRRLAIPAWSSAS